MKKLCNAIYLNKKKIVLLQCRCVALCSRISHKVRQWHPMIINQEILTQKNEKNLVISSYLLHGCLVRHRLLLLRKS